MKYIKKLKLYLFGLMFGPKLTKEAELENWMNLEKQKMLCKYRGLEKNCNSLAYW